MPAYPGLERYKRVSFDVLLEFVADIFLHCGMRPGDASLLAGTLAAADVRGVQFARNDPGTRVRTQIIKRRR
jgi:hypothetical protein